ncbi:hypothetical protein QBC38DRAFT_478769, partial [Podospora fimiseda]
MGINSSVQVGEGERGLREQVFISETFYPVPTPLRRRCIRRSVPMPAAAEPTPGPEKEEGNNKAEIKPTTMAGDDPPKPTDESSDESKDKPTSSNGTTSTGRPASATSSAASSTTSKGTGRVGSGSGDESTSSDGSNELLPHETTSAPNPSKTDDGSIGSGKPGSGGRKSTVQIVAIIGAIIAAILVLILLWWMATRLWKNWKEKRILSLAKSTSSPPLPPLPVAAKEKGESGSGAMAGAGLILLHELPGPELSINLNDEPQELDTPVIEVDVRSSAGGSFMASSFDAVSVDEMSMREMRPTSM